MPDGPSLQLVDAQFIELREQMRDYDALRGGGGGGTSDGMEPRVARLEKNVDTLSADTAAVRVDLATLKENVRHLPTKSFIVTATTTTIGLIGALVLFADKLRALIGS